MVAVWFCHTTIPSLASRCVGRGDRQEFCCPLSGPRHDLRNLLYARQTLAEMLWGAQRGGPAFFPKTTPVSVYKIETFGLSGVGWGGPFKKREDVRGASKVLVLGFG